MKIASGTVLDRPWGLTLGTVGMRKLDALVTVRSDDGKTYAVAFQGGAVVAAASPLPNDSVTRVALTSHFVSPTQVGDITRRLAADKQRDEVEIVVAAARLSAEHAATLRRRLVSQRAARTFAIDRATFEIEDAITLALVPGFSVPLGAVIFQGVRMNLSEQRLVADLRELGSSFTLRPTTTDDDIASYNFEGDIRSVIKAVRAGTTFAELELASHRDIEPRTLHAMLYALVCAGHCDATGGQHVERTAPPLPRTATSLPKRSHTRITVDQPLITRSRSGTTQSPANVSRTLSPQPTERSRAVSQPPATQRTVTSPGTFTPRTESQTLSPLDEFMKDTTTHRGHSSLEALQRDAARSGSGVYPIIDELGPESATSKGHLAVPRTITTPRTITERDRAKREIEALIATRLAKLEQGCDYFVILGLPVDAPLDAVRNNYVEISRRLHPDSLAQLGIADEGKGAQRVLAQVNAAFQILTDPAKRRDYVSSQKRGEPTPIAPRARTGDLDKTELAAEAFEAGEGALKRDDIPRAVEELSRAVTLAPSNLEYMAMFAWAQFCAAADKQKIYGETRKTLERAIQRGEKPVTARFYLGRVERMIGHDREAMNHFQEVLLDEPHNREAASEVRVLEQRLARGTKPKR